MGIGIGIDHAARTDLVIGIDHAVRTDLVIGIDRVFGIDRVGGIDPITGIDRVGGTNPITGIDRVGGTDPSTGIDRVGETDPITGIDRVIGIDPITGIDRVGGIDPSTGIDRVGGTDPSTGIDRVIGIDRVGGIDPSTGIDRVGGIGLIVRLDFIVGIDLPVLVVRIRSIRIRIAGIVLAVLAIPVVGGGGRFGRGVEGGAMRIGERVLLALSRDPAGGDYADAAGEPTVDGALDNLRRRFPDLAERVRGKRVLDFGCGAGWQAAALAREGAARVVGLDTNAATLARARALAARLGIGEDRLAFAEEMAPGMRGAFDVVVSQDAMEHFGDPEGALRAMASALAPGGRLLVTFGPPWYAPSGSHMHFFTRVPWVHLLFSERTVMAVRARFRADGARRYEEVESGLNRMSLARFERVVARSGLRVEARRDACVRGVDGLARAPLLRELFVNNVSCVLSATSAGLDTGPDADPTSGSSVDPHADPAAYAAGLDLSNLRHR